MFIPIEFQKAHEKTEKAFIRIVANYQATCAITDSKLGGVAYYPQGEDYPKDATGNPLFLLAQINFFEMPTHPELPDTGILQIFIPCDDEYYGANFEQPLTNNKFVVRYWAHSDLPSQNITVKTNEDSLIPIFGEHRLHFKHEKDCAGIESIECAIAMAANPIEVLEDVALSEKEEETFYQAIESKTNTSGHKLLGNAYFIDTDPRETEVNANYRLLLQIDTDLVEDNDIMWGDEGVAHFFITEADLKAKNFSRLWYSWDCH